jgi:hypothetical protein
MPQLKIHFSAQCRTCNPDEPVFYEDRDERDYEAQQHSNMTGHILDVGFAIKQ